MTEITELAVVEASNPLAGLPPEILAKIRSAANTIQNTATMSTRKIGVAKGGMGYKMPDDTNVKRFTAAVVAVKHANKNYPSAYVAGKYEPADCVAVCMGTDDATNEHLVPLPPKKYASTWPTGATNCASCPRYQWGSNPNGSGKGKLCNEYTLAAVYIPALGEDLFLVEQKKARGQKFDTHIRRITDAFAHPAMVWTEFSIAENNEAFEQNFYPVDAVPMELFMKLAGRIDEANAILVDSVKNSLEGAQDIPFGDVPPAEEDQVRPASRGKK
jgi:hypothetical protein